MKTITLSMETTMCTPIMVKMFPVKRGRPRIVRTILQAISNEYIEKHTYRAMFNSIKFRIVTRTWLEAPSSWFYR